MYRCFFPARIARQSMNKNQRVKLNLPATLIVRDKFTTDSRSRHSNDSQRADISRCGWGCCLLVKCQTWVMLWSLQLQIFIVRTHHLYSGYAPGHIVLAFVLMTAHQVRNKAPMKQATTNFLECLGYIRVLHF